MAAGLSALFLLDAKNVDLSKNMDFNKIRNSVRQNQCYFALFNSDYHMHIEKEALARGFQGVFYNEDDLEIIKGKSTVLIDELPDSEQESK